MLRSMTGFSRATIQKSLGRFTAEIRSLNRKFLEISTFLPKEFSHLEAECRTKIGSYLTRGQIQLSIAVSYEESAPVKIVPNLFLARQLKTAWKEISDNLQLENSLFRLDLLKDQPELFYSEPILENEENYRQIFFQVIEEALEHLMTMKKVEGDHIAEDIEKRLQFIHKCIEDIALVSRDAPQKYRQKLLEKFEEILPGRIENEERILREIVLYADKVDITEEITRFRSHLDRFKDILASSESTVGKKIDFLIQELNREINTIGSKSSDLRISYLVMDSKLELEKIREQIQNIE